MGGTVGEDSGKPDDVEARAMLDCAPVSESTPSITSSGEKEWFRRDLPLAELGRMLPALLDDATKRKRNVIIRPHGPNVTLLQLDDLKAHQLPAVAFLTLETSPGNYQAWLAIPGKLDKEFASRVRKGSGADIGASGATRIPGSFNFKPDHAPENTGRAHYPRVRQSAISYIRRVDDGGLISTTAILRWAALMRRNGLPCLH